MKIRSVSVVLCLCVGLLLVTAGCGKGTEPAAPDEALPENAVNIIDLQYGRSDRATSIDVATAMIQANKNVDGMFASNEPGVFGILRAIEERDLKGEIKVVGFDASEELVDGLKEGYIDALVAQDPFNIGYEAVHQMVRHLEGEDVPKNFSTNLALITRDNLDTPKIKNLLNPPLDKYLNAEMPEDPEYHLAVVPKGMVHIFWQTVHAGAVKAALEFNCHITWQGTQNETQHSEQSDIITGFVAKGVDGLVIGPTQADSQVGAIEKAVAKGIPVVVFDSDANTDKYTCFVATNNYKGGAMAAEKLYELLGGKGNVCIVGTMPGGGSTMQREKGFLEKMKELGANGADKFIK